MKYDAFISYRRDVGSEAAFLIKNELLKRKFRDDRIFLDTTSLGGGNSEDNFLNALEDSQNIIVVITNGCFNNIAESNWIKELELAIKRNKHIIPVFFNGIDKISRENLPDSIKSLADKNAATFIHQYPEICFEKLSELMIKDSSSKHIGMKIAGSIGFVLAIVFALLLIKPKARTELDIDKSYPHLTIYKVPTNRIELVIGEKPSPDEYPDVLFCCSAAFVGKQADSETQFNIDGDIIVNGKLRYGNVINENPDINGGFAVKNRKWKFIEGDYTSAIRNTTYITAFAQHRNIIDGKVSKPFLLKDNSKLNYRSLCEIDGTLYIIDSDGEISYTTFVNTLETLGVDNSIFLVKEGMDYSWYRKKVGSEASYINRDERNTTNNWIIFHQNKSDKQIHKY